MKNVQIRIFALLSFAFLCFPSTAAYVYQNFEDGNGYPEYGWSWYNSTVGRSGPGEPTRDSPHSWKMQSGAWGGTGIPSAVNTWNVDFLFGGNDRLTFWVYAMPFQGENRTRVRFFDQGSYHSDGFEVESTQTVLSGQWTQISVLFSQLPANFDLHHVDKIVVTEELPGTYYFDDFRLVRDDRVYQSFEPELRSGSNLSEYAWRWSEAGNALSFSSAPEPVLEGLHSLKFVTNQGDTGIGIQCEFKTFSGNAQSFWNVNLNPEQNDLFSVWVYALPETGLDATLEVHFFDHGNYSSQPKKFWATESAKYGQWTKLTVPFSKFPGDFNLHDLNKIEFYVRQPGTYYFDRLAAEGRVPELRFFRETGVQDKLIWNALPEAPQNEIRTPNHYEVQRSSDGTNWQTILDGTNTEFSMEGMNPAFFRIRSRHELGYNANSFPWDSSWSSPLEYFPAQAFIDHAMLLESGLVTWNAVPGAASYEVQISVNRQGPWQSFYQGAYPQNPLPASGNDWHRVRSVNASGETSPWSAPQKKSANPTEDFLRAQGTSFVDGQGNAVALRGVNLGSEFLTEGYLTQIQRLPDVNGNPKYEDDWHIREELKDRFGEEGKNQLVDLWEHTWCSDTDLDQLWRMGVNTVRLPLFYRNLQDENGEWIRDSSGNIDFSKIDRIVQGCANRGMQVLLDLHGAPGSQSAEFHTGQEDFDRLFKEDEEGEEYRQKTILLWETIADHYKNEPFVLGYDLLNEPTGATPAQLHDFYNQLYQKIRAKDPHHLLMMEGIFGWDTLPDPNAFGWQNVAYQFHLYFWSQDKNIQGHKDFVDDFLSQTQISQSQYQIPVMIGEFQGFVMKEVWEYYLQKFNEHGLSWTLWNFKSRDPHSTWGLFTLNKNEDHFPKIRATQPDGSTPDSFAELQSKFSHYDTFNHGSLNKALCEVVKKYLKAATLPPGGSTEGLVVRYSFDSEESGHIPDESGHGNDAQIIGSPISSEGHFGSGMEFHPGEYLRADTNPSAGWNQITVSLWFKTNDPSQNYKLASAAWWHGTTDGSGWNMGTHYSELWSDGSPDSIRTEGAWPRSQPLLPGEWNHLVLTYDGNRIKEYVNGELSVNVASSGMPFGSGMPLEVGAWSSVGFTNYQGLLDEFRLYDRALSEAEVSELYQGSSPAPRPANQPPVAVISGATTWELQNANGALVQLSGTSSSDPDSSLPLQNFVWSGSFGSLEGSTLAATLSLGKHTVILRVFDGTDWSQDVSFTVTVQDTTRPQVTITSPLTQAYKVSDPATTVEFSATDKSGSTKTQATLNGKVTSLHQKIKWVDFLDSAKNLLRVQAMDPSGNSAQAEGHFSVQNSPQILKDWLTTAVKSKKLTQALATQMQTLLTKYAQQKTAAQKAAVLKELLKVWDTNKSKVEAAFYSDFRKALTYLK